MKLKKPNFNLNFRFKSAFLSRLNSPAILWGIFSGILVGTTYIPFYPWALFFCYVPLWYFNTLKTNELGLKDALKSAFWSGWWTQFVLSLIGFYWISFVSKDFGGMPWPVAILVLILFASFIHLYIPFSVVAVELLKQKKIISKAQSLFVFPMMLWLFERYYPTIFPWHLGYPLLKVQWPVFHTAEIWGFEGLSFWVLMMQSLVLMLVLPIKSYRKNIAVILLVIGFILPQSFGLYLKTREKNQLKNNLSVLVVQANIGNLEKTYAEKGAGYQDFIIDEYFQMTQMALTQNKVDLVVWPETAYPEFLDPEWQDKKYYQKLKAFIAEIKTPLLTGAYSKTTATPNSKSPKPGKLGQPATVEHNGLYLFNTDGVALEPHYNKTELLVFGEYTPFVDIFPALAKVSPAGTGFERGPGPTVYPFSFANEKINLGLQICYESLDPAFSAGLINKKAHVLVNVTNDSWFGNSAENSQHMYMTLARAVEFRRPLIRSTNTGITTVIQSDGTIENMSPAFQKGYGIFDVGYNPVNRLTFYAEYGELVPAVVFFALMLMIFLRQLKKALRERKVNSEDKDEESEVTKENTVSEETQPETNSDKA